MSTLEKELGDLTTRLEEVLGAAAGEPGSLADGIARALEPLEASLRDAVSGAINQLGQLDPATSVLTRQALEEAAGAEFSRALRYRRELSAVSLGIDGFSGIRDAQGADGADDFLRTVILDCCRGIRACDIVGRSDEAVFSILLPETPLAGAVQVGDRLRSIMRETPIPVGDVAISYTISVGVGTADTEDVNSGPLLARVGEALRLAREAGPDAMIVARQTFVDDEMTVEDPELDFHKALGSVSIEYLRPDEL
jgi:diguanylate cyclase (GGDEF)-like protein